jgi:hypothetical protein
MTVTTRARRDRWISVMVFAALAGIWQILSVVYTAEAQPGEPMIAGWQVLFTKTFLTLSDYWQGGLGVSAVADGAERSYLAALLAIRSPSASRVCAIARLTPPIPTATGSRVSSNCNIG